MLYCKNYSYGNHGAINLDILSDMVFKNAINLEYYQKSIDFMHKCERLYERQILEAIHVCMNTKL